MERLKRFFEKLENTPSVTAIKSGLIMVIPVLMIGSAALVFKHFPIIQYQDFIATALSGKLLAFFDFIYNATFGMFSIYLTSTISFSYARQHNYSRLSLVPPITALICFFIVSGVTVDSATWDAFGVKGVFIAILLALFVTKLLLAFLSVARKKSHGFSDDADVEFNYSVSVILPMTATIGIFLLANMLIVDVFHVQSVFQLLVNAANAVFFPLGRSFASGILMVLVSSILWFFGIHGSDILESVMSNLFTPAIQTNIALVAAGQAPTEIFTKQFFDIFVLMGGCGTAICLLLAIVFFSKRSRNRRLSRLSALPLLFNINELMIFGYPVIFNVTLLIPFILTPLFAFLTTYCSMKAGLVPLTIAEVNWTAPVLLSGYMATGSIAGSLLQLFNIIVGVFIYRPFVKAYDRQCEKKAQTLIGKLVDLKKKSESDLFPVVLTELTDSCGALARSLVSDLKYALSQNSIELYYQPQYDNRRHCIGAESLLRWKHPLYGMMYPPLMIQLARESGLLVELEEYVLKRSVEDAAMIKKRTGFNKKISVNISSATILNDHYFSLLKSLVGQGAVHENEICLEVTEQTAMPSGDATFERLRQIKDLGYHLAIDDFSMGHTSLIYLQENYFDIVKLDGFLVTEMTNNPRSYDIIKNITLLSKKLGFNVIAEYVEDEQQVKMLEAAGCVHYQGYLFSKAISRDEFTKRILAEAQR